MIKPQATVQYENPVNVRSKSYCFWSTNYTALRGINIKVYKKTDKKSLANMENKHSQWGQGKMCSQWVQMRHIEPITTSLWRAQRFFW